MFSGKSPEAKLKHSPPAAGAPCEGCPAARAESVIHSCAVAFECCYLKETVVLRLKMFPQCLLWRFAVQIKADMM